MLKRILIILSLLVVPFLSYSQSTHIVEAAEQTKDTWRTGNTVAECVFLEKDLYIKIIRDTSLCAVRVEQHRNSTCTDKVMNPFDKINGDILISGKPPRTTASCVGNKCCDESIVAYPKTKSFCYEYHSGCRTRYIPPG